MPDIFRSYIYMYYSFLINILSYIWQCCFILGKVLAVLFMQYAMAYRIMGLVNTIHGTKNVIWIGGDAWIGREPPSGFENVINGAIGISPKTKKYPGFAEYFKE